MWASADVPEYFDSYYFRVRLAGKPQQLRSADTTVKAEAIERGKLVIEAMTSDKWEQLRAALDGTRIRRACCTMGQWEDAFLKVAEARKIESQRPVAAMRLVLAIVKGWKTPFDSTTRITADLVAKIRELPASLVNEQTKQDFWRLSQAASLGRELRLPILDTKAPPEVNGTINSTLQNARTMCSRTNRIYDVAGLSIPWPDVDGFVKGSLPERDKDWGVDLPTPEAFAKMLESADWLAASANAEDRELALCNEVFRTLGLRSREMVNARESWLEDGKDGRCYMVLRHRPEDGWTCKTGTAGRLPIHADLAARLRARCAAARARGVVNPFLILPEPPGVIKARANRDAMRDKWEDPERAALVRGRHNEWLKGFIGEVKSNQGNHRLRKYLATMLYEVHGLKVALQYLRHSKEAVAFESYIKQREEKLPIVRREALAAWGVMAEAA